MITQEVNGLVRSIRFYPAFDKRSDDPKKDYGVGSVQMLWMIQGPLGAVQFSMSSGWHLHHVAMDLQNEGYHGYMATDLGYHSPKPEYDDQKPMHDCPFIEGGTCYYDGSSLNAGAPFHLLTTQGGERVWTFLEDYYRSRFEDAPYPDPDGWDWRKASW